jgi:flagellar assembly protein FliH
MIWSDAPTPFAQPLPGVATTPTPWMLTELDAADGEIFRTASGDVVPTEAELAAAAQVERERAMADGFDAGYRAGVADAQAASSARLAGAIETLESAAAVLRENQARYIGALEDNLAALAVCVAKQIIAREVRTSPEITAELIRNAIAEFPIDEALRIRVNPIDLSALSLARDGEPTRVASRPDISWMPDPRVSSGGCVVEGRERIMDGRVDAALERAYRRLTNTTA